MNSDPNPETVQGPVYPESRELKRPYFLLRARGGEKPFYAPELQGIIRDPKDPFSRYLPAAQLDNVQRPTRVTFELPQDVDPETLTRLDSIPESTITAFEKSARTFLEAEGLDPFRSEIRESFQLPDPEEEPDAWWIYGPPENRQLLVLWGCEFQRGNSLPLLPDSRKPNSPCILDRLKSRKMQWGDYQRQMRDLLLAGSEPLSRFIGKPERGRNGEWKSILHRGKRMDWEKTKPLKTVGRGEIAAYENAASEFYGRAHPGSAAASDFEKELRIHFRLPDPEKQPDYYRVHNGKLIIAVPDDLSREEALCLQADDTLDLPPAQPGEGGAEIIPDTVADKLQDRATPWLARGIAAGVILVLLIAAAVLFEMFADRTPPAVESIISENTPERVLVRFNEEVHPGSLEFAEVVTDEEAARGKANTPAFQIEKENGDRINIRDIQPVGDVGNEVELVTESMPEGNYILTVQGVRDVSRKKNRIANPLEAGFQVVDTIPPSLDQVSADNEDARAVLLFFNEPLDRTTATQRTNYTVRGASIVRAEVLDGQDTIRLHANKAFVEEQPYTLEIGNLQDDSSLKNPIPEPITFTFTYRDTIPPSVESVQATRSQVQVTVGFSESVTPETAQVPAHYKLFIDGEASGPAIDSAVLYDDGVTVALTTKPLYNGVTYGLLVENVRDQGGGGTVAMEEPIPFRFTGREDKEPPLIEKVTVRFQQNFWVTFNEPVDLEPLLNGDRWSFSDPALRIEGDPVQSDSEGTRVKFKTTERTTNQVYTLSIDGAVSDLIGNTADGLTSPEFRGVNMDIIPTNTLQITKITPADEDGVLVLEFNEAVVTEALETEANYILTRGLQVQRATADPTDAKVVFLYLNNSLDSGIQYELTLQNMRTRRAPGVAISSLSQRFTAP